MFRFVLEESPPFAPPPQQTGSWFAGVWSEGWEFFKDKEEHPRLVSPEPGDARAGHPSSQS